MIITEGDAKLAYTYAWWLTGADDAARAAVLAAVARPEVPGADDALRVEILLRRVRAAAIDTPTMCPASELALLHDGIGLELDPAAGLAMIDAREARTELAHGRLEALGADVPVDIVEPQRLGGLAVGNPADVAAARQNPQLAHLRQLLQQGRDELVALTPVAVPDDLVQAVAAAPEPGPVAPPAPAEPAGRRDVEDHRPAPHPPEAQQPGAPAPAEQPGRSAGTAIWLVVGLAAVVAIFVLLTNTGDDPFPEDGADAEDQLLPVPDGEEEPAPVPSAPPSPEVEPSPTAAATAPPTATPSPSPSAAGGDPTPGLQIVSTGVAVGLGAEPDPANPIATPFDPISFAVTYTGAAEGEMLIAGWTVDGTDFAIEQVALVPGDSTSRFTQPIPQDGWPGGQHVLALTRAGQGEVLGEVRFQVVAEPGG